MNKSNKNAIKGVIAVVAIVLVCSALARFMKGSETLAEYAATHPDEQVQVQITPVIEEQTNPVLPVDADNAESIDDTEIEGDDEDVLEDSEIDISKDKPAFFDEYADSEERIIYEPEFFYEPIPDAVKAIMKGVSYPLDIDESQISYDDLRYLNILYADFEGQVRTGQLVCNKLIAEDLVEIFYELYTADYRVESVKLIDEFDADDTASMSANNTSCFCYRVVDGTTKMSDHAYGMAIDVNPYYNPYIVMKSGEDDYISPPGSEIYADRSVNNHNPYRIDENDLAYKLFKEHGFKWGGDWNNTKDYQHFYKKIK